MANNYYMSKTIQSVASYQEPPIAQTLKRPSGFGFNWNTYFPHDIYFNEHGVATTTFNPYNYYPYSGNPLFYGWDTYYLDNVGGNDSNVAPFTPSNALKSMSVIVTAVNAGSNPAIIWVKATGTDYIRTNAWNGGTRFNKAVCVVGWNGRPVFGLHDNATWTNPDGTYANCGSTTTFTTVARIVDISNKDTYGDYTELTEVATPTLCNTTENSWCQDGSKVYVNRSDNAAISNSNTRCYRPSVEGARCPTSGNSYIWGIQFEGGNNGSYICDSNASSSHYLFNCTGKWAGRASGLTDNFKARDVAFMLCYNCTAAHSTSDGFDYTAASGTTPTGVLINCNAYLNGAFTSTSNNGITAHDGVKLLVIGGTTANNYGANIAFADTTAAGTQIYIVGHSSKDSYGDTSLGGTIPPINYQALSASKLWLESCSSVMTNNSRYDLSAEGTSNIYYNNFRSKQGPFNRTLSTGAITSSF